MKYQKPPLGASVDWSHPLANGLEALWLMNEAMGDKVFDATRHGHDGTRNGMVDNDWSATEKGSSLDFDANTKWTEVTTTARLADMDELTLFALIKITGNPGTGWGRIIHKANGASSDDYHIAAKGASPINSAAMRIRTSAVTTTNTPTAMAAGTLHSVVGTWRGSDGSIDLYEIDSNGLVNTATAMRSGTLNDAAENLAIGRHKDSTTRNFNGEILVAGIARRKWTREDAEWFAAEPYAMIAELEPQTKFSTVVVAAGQPYYIRDSYSMPDFLGNQQS